MGTAGLQVAWWLQICNRQGRREGKRDGNAVVKVSLAALVSAVCYHEYLTLTSKEAVDFESVHVCV